MKIKRQVSTEKLAHCKVNLNSYSDSTSESHDAQSQECGGWACAARNAVPLAGPGPRLMMEHDCN